MKTKARLILENKGKILLLKSARKQNRYCFIGGSVGKLEFPKEALVREAREEVSMELNPEKLILLGVEQFESHGIQGNELFFQYVDPKVSFELIEHWKFEGVEWILINKAHQFLNVSGARFIGRKYLNKKAA